MTLCRPATSSGRARSTPVAPADLRGPGKTNPIPVKAGLELLGICSARARLPIVEADDEQRAEVRRALEAHGLLAGSAA